MIGHDLVSVAQPRLINLDQRVVSDLGNLSLQLPIPSLSLFGNMLFFSAGFIRNGPLPGLEPTLPNPASSAAPVAAVMANFTST